MPRNRERKMRSVLKMFGLLPYVWALALAINRDPTQPSQLPFRFYHACANTDTTTTTTTSPAPTPSPFPDNTTSPILLFYDGGTVGSSPCRCRILSPVSLTWMKTRASTNLTTTTHLNQTLPLRHKCGGAQGEADTACRWNASSQHPLALTITPELQGEKEGKWKNEDYVFLLLQGTDGAVEVQCEETPDVTAPPPSRSTTGSNITAANTNDTTPAEPAPTSDVSENGTTALTTSHSRGGAHMDSTQPPIDSENTGAACHGRDITEAKHDDGAGVLKDSTEYLVLGVAVALMIIAVIIIIVAVVKLRKRSKTVDVEKTAARKPPKQKVGTTTTTTSGRGSQVNDNHNYEEVSDDGLGDGVRVGVGAGAGAGVRGDRKVSNVSMPTGDNYTRIKAGSAAGGAHPQRNTTPALHHPSSPSTSTPADTDDYSRLQLGKPAAPVQGQGQGVKDLPSPATKSFFVSEDDEYMDVNNDDDDDSGGGGDDDADDGDAGNDIYEAVDADPERTPLCPRRAEGREEVYTDCISGDDRKMHVVGAASKGGKGSNLPLSNHTPLAPHHPHSRPTLPTSPPPLASKGLHRNNSRSVDSLVRDRFHAAQQQKKQQQRRQKQKQHHHSQSLDLNLCQQRDLFLQQFRRQGDGAESAPTTLQPPEGDYSNVVMKASPTSHTNPAPPRKPPPTSPPQAEHPPNAQPQVMMRRKAGGSSRKKGVGGCGEGGRLTMADLDAVRQSMEIRDDELIMIDNIVYGTLPRDLSLPTTEL
ncbi:uncharacterized protein LOC143282988 [Babylonia areolata]|uniref:uncharacterized protein LOC143282988 n=1 Tax=Babylonia areolata TaxID=304850 RepID=UPI003FCF4702